MIKAPKFSIIIPVYNVENYLSECLDSIIVQTILDLEIICVNDGTKDRSRKILEEYQQRDCRIQIIDKENGGLSSARNAGLKAATGDYVMFVDSDDFLESQACERIYYEILEHKPEVVVFGAHIFPYYPWPTEWLVRNLTTRSTVYYNQGVDALLNENGATPFVWRDCFRREFLETNKLVFDESIRFGEDLIFQFEAFPSARKIIFISDKLYHYRWRRPDSLMANASKDLFRKYNSHVDAMNIIAKYWKSHNFLETYGPEFFCWSVLFIGWDIFNYSGRQKDILVARVQNFWEEYGFNKYASCLSVKSRVYYSYIQNYHLNEQRG